MARLALKRIFNYSSLRWRILEVIYTYVVSRSSHFRWLGDFCLFVSSSLQFSTLTFTLGLSSPVSATLGAGVTDVQTWDAWLVDGC